MSYLCPSSLFLQVSKDDRSDIESSSDEDDSPPPLQKHHSSATNGTNKNHGTNGYLTGVPYPDEHWLSLYLYISGAVTQTPSIYLCVYVFECVVDTRTASSLRHWSFVLKTTWLKFCYRSDSYTFLQMSHLCRAHTYIYIYICIRISFQWDAEALVLALPTLFIRQLDDSIPLCGVSMLL